MLLEETLAPRVLVLGASGWGEASAEGPGRGLASGLGCSMVPIVSCWLLSRSCVPGFNYSRLENWGEQSKLPKGSLSAGMGYRAD